MEEVMELVLVERTFPEPIDPKQLLEAASRGHWCLELHNVTPVHSYMSADRLRMICVFMAPDAESVRKANTTAGLPFERVWTAHRLFENGAVQLPPTE
jgi:hypothetical protein